MSDGKRFFEVRLKGRLWGSGNDSKGDTVEESASTSTKYADPTVQFLKDFIVSQGGTFGMAKLSGLLKRNFPEHRARIGSIRKWVSDHDDVFNITNETILGQYLMLGIGMKIKLKRPRRLKQSPLFWVDDW